MGEKATFSRADELLGRISNPDYIYHYGDTISLEEFEKLRIFFSNIDEAFKYDMSLNDFATNFEAAIEHDIYGNDDGPWQYPYQVTMRCESCNKVFTKSLNGNDLIASITSCCVKCDKCNDLEKIRNNFSKEKKKYIDTYLNPDCIWKKQTTVSNMEKSIKIDIKPFSKDYAELSRYIRLMNYSNYLQTPYWKFVAKKKREGAKMKCQLCGKKGILNVHHNSYAHTGYEFLYPEDLIVLCDKCHSKFHSKNEHGNTMVAELDL